MLAIGMETQCTLQQVGGNTGSTRGPGADEQARHIASVGILAAYPDLTHSGEVVHVVLLDLGVWKVTHRSFKNVSGKPGPDNGFRFTDRDE